MSLSNASLEDAAHGDTTHTDEMRALGSSMSDLDLASSAKMSAVPTLDTLAPELKLKILSELPIRQIPKLRQTCTAFHALIDEHESSIVQESTKASLSELDEVIGTLIDYSTKTVDGKSAFFKALTAFVTLRGMVEPSMCFEWMEIIAWFLSNWQHRLAVTNETEKREKENATDEKLDQVDADAEASDESPFSNPLYGAVDALTTLHVHYHGKGCDLGEHVTHYRDKWLNTAPGLVGLDSFADVQAILQAVEDGAWLAAKIHPSCPVTSCGVDAPISPYGIYPDPFWDMIKEENKTEEAEKKAREEQEAAAIKDAEDGWSIVGKKRKQAKRTAPRPREPVSFEFEMDYRAGTTEAGKQAIDEMMSRPIMCASYGIYYEEEDGAEPLEPRFQRMFGVPSVLEGTPFRYFVKSAWAYDLMTKVLSGKGEMTNMEKAAILEELYVY